MERTAEIRKNLVRYKSEIIILDHVNNYAQNWLLKYQNFLQHYHA